MQFIYTESSSLLLQKMMFVCEVLWCHPGRRRGTLSSSAHISQAVRALTDWLLLSCYISLVTSEFLFRSFTCRAFTHPGCKTQTLWWLTVIKGKTTNTDQNPDFLLMLMEMRHVYTTKVSGWLWRFKMNVNPHTGIYKQITFWTLLV